MANVTKFFKKMVKVPSAVWVLGIALTYFFANAYNIISSTEIMVAEISTQMTEMGLDASRTMVTVKAMSFVMQPLLALAVFELIVSAIYRSLYMRRRVSNDVNYFKTVARVIYCAGNLIIGVLSLMYFWVPSAAYIGSATINFTVYTATYTLIFAVLAASVIDRRDAYDAFMTLYAVYFVLLGALGIIDTVSAFVTDDIGLNVRIGTAVRMGLIVIAALLEYFIYAKKLNKRAKEIPVKASDNEPTITKTAGGYTMFEGGAVKNIHVNPEDIVIPKDDNDKPDPPDEVFKGFGF